MKKLLTLLAVMLLAAACEGPMGPQGPQGPRGADGADGADGALNMLVVDSDELFVTPDDWVRHAPNGEFSHFYHDFFIENFTSTVFNRGIYNTYWKYAEGDGTGNLIQIQEGLGATMFLSWVNDEGETIFFSETVTCDYSVGNLRINYYISDFEEIKPTETMYFRFVAVW